MYFSFTDGRSVDVPDMCSCCFLGTGGEHELICHVANQLIKEVRYVTFFNWSYRWIINRHLSVDKGKVSKT